MCLFRYPLFYLLNVLYERICQVMPIAKTIKRVANHIFPAMKNEQYSKVSQTNETEITFTRRGIALFSMKFRMYGPNRLWFNSHLYSRGEPRNHKILDNKRNGVVGNKGRKIPITPKHREILPKTIYMTFTSQKYKDRKSTRLNSSHSH